MASTDPTSGEPAEPSTADADAVSDPDAEAAMTAAPLNRAERRARRAGKSPQQPAGKGKVGRQKGPVQNPRMWANRRSG